MSCSKVFTVLVMALAIKICYTANIPMSRGEISTTTEESAKLQQLTFEKDSNGAFNSADSRVQMCKSSCIQKCLENRKLLKTSDDSHSPNNDSLQTEENDVMKKESQRQSQLVHEQCLGGCTEACSFYKRLLILGNEHTKSSFVTGDSVISQQTTQKSVSSSPVSDYISSTSIPATTLASTHEHDDGAVADSSVTTDKRLGGVAESFELRLSSLIHQKSLVIAELKWDDIGGIPNQAYLVTWEMTDGGLKGHLVTDSSSVTLSLWPGTTYRIQVQQFKPMLEADGSQPPETSTPKSVPLIVDTSEASFPLGRSSPLFSNEEVSDYNLEEHSLYHEEDEYAQDGNEMEEEEEENEDDKSSEGLHSMTSLLGVSLCATVLVIVLLSLAAFTWIHFQTLRKVECFSCCFTSDEEPQLLSHEDLSDVLCTEKTTPTTGKSLKFYRMPSLFGFSKEYKVAGLYESDVPISAICSGSPAPHSVLHCSLNNAWSKGTFYEPATTTASTTSMKENSSAHDRISSISELVSENVQQ